MIRPTPDITRTDQHSTTDRRPTIRERTRLRQVPNDPVPLDTAVATRTNRTGPVRRREIVSSTASLSVMSCIRSPTSRATRRRAMLMPAIPAPHTVPRTGRRPPHLLPARLLLPTTHQTVRTATMRHDTATAPRRTPRQVRRPTMSAIGRARPTTRATASPGRDPPRCERHLRIATAISKPAHRRSNPIHRARAPRLSRQITTTRPRSTQQRVPAQPRSPRKRPGLHPRSSLIRIILRARSTLTVTPAPGTESHTHPETARGRRSLPTHARPPTTRRSVRTTPPARRVTSTALGGRPLRPSKRPDPASCTS